jgi:hypothetical protein
MSTDLIKKFVIDIEYEIENIRFGCSGVIFKSNTDARIDYLLTAKHLFFPKDIYGEENYFKKVTQNKIPLEPEKLTLIRYSREKLTISNYANYAYFPQNPESDIAIIPLKLHENTTHSLKIFDFDNTEYEKINFLIAGYTKESKESKLPIKLKSYEVQHVSFEEDQSKEESGIAKLRSKMVLAFGSRDTVYKSLNGISGAGAFVCDHQEAISLAYIVSGVDDINTFLCTRIDMFIDELNLLLESQEVQDNFPPLETNTEVFIEDEYLKFEEFSDFSFLEDSIKTNAESASNKLLKSSLIDYNHDFQKEVAKLHKEHRELRNLENTLSYLYAYYAILANKNKKRHASAILFKKAIELNPKHQQAFVLQKAKKDDNTEKMQMASESVEDIKNTCLEKIKNEINHHIKRETIKDAIFKINITNEDANFKEERINTLLQELNKSYEQDITLKDTYKYYAIGQYYHSIANHYEKKPDVFGENLDKYDYSFLYLTISKLLLDESYIFEEDHELRGATDELLTDIVEKVKNKKVIEQLAVDEVEKILNARQNKNAKQTLAEIKEILLSIGYDTLQLKQSNSDERLLISTIKNRTAKIHENLIAQNLKNNQHHLDIDQTNKNIKLITEASENLKEQIEKTPDKYQIFLDAETKKEIKDTIDSQLYETVSKLDQVSEISEKIQDYVTNAESHLNTILHEEKISLEEKNTQLSSVIKKLEESQISVDDMKTHTINHLKSSEKRMIARLNQLNINERTQYRAVQVIQESISQLQRNVKAIKMESPFKNKHEKIHSLRSEIEEIINTCQNLESRILARLDDTPSYHTDIDFIKRSQTRFEHALLPKVMKALDTGINFRTNELNNYEAIPEQDNITLPSFSSRRKILLIVCLIILFVSIGYILLKFSNYSLLDLLTNLWHTAWQKFNG